MKKDSFLGQITSVLPDQIAIKNVFHNVRKLKSEVKIGRDEIEEIEFVKIADPTQNSVALQDPTSPSAKPFKPVQNYSIDSKKLHKPAKPIAILPAASSSISQTLKPDKSKKKHNFKNHDLMQPDEEEIAEDFDFEGNLALFDKKEIFKEIDNENIFGFKSNVNHKPDLVRQLNKQEEKYRHDENILDSMLLQFKNVQLEFKPKQEYTTDEPYIVIPSIPLGLRDRIQNLAHDHGYAIERQNDLLARGATELALNLLGGQRRLSPKNLHQWPTVTIICDEPYNFRQSEVGLSCGRQLASHGLKVVVYVKTSSHSDESSKELELYTATGNDFAGNVKDLLQSDLVIMAVTKNVQNSQVVRYIQENRAPVLAINPPTSGISEIVIRNSVVPILPLDSKHFSQITKPYLMSYSCCRHSKHLWKNLSR